MFLYTMSTTTVQRRQLVISYHNRNIYDNILFGNSTEKLLIKNRIFPAYSACQISVYIICYYDDIFLVDIIYPRQKQ